MDGAGNTIDDVLATSDATSVIFDSVLPTVTDLSISSNNNFDNDNSTSLAKAGDDVTIEFFTSEPIQEPSSTISQGALVCLDLTQPGTHRSQWRRQIQMDQLLSP